MDDKIEEAHIAAESFVRTLREKDRALVIDFDDRVYLIQDLTGDQEALVEAVTSTEAIGGTSLYDALHAAFRKLKGIKGRKAMVVLSDGEDTSSQFGYRRVIEEAKANNVIIYAIGLGSGIGKGALKEFSDITGGRSFFVGKAEQLAGVYERIAEELRQQLYLTYSTSIEEWDGSWIRLKVETDRPGHKVRARRGFFSVRSDGK
jgi:Ca-activated chloride channel family protein